MAEEEETTPEETTPEAEETTPEEGETTPEETTPVETTLEEQETTPAEEETTPVETTPEDTTPEETTPEEEATPAETTPIETTPEETTPEEARPASVTFEDQTSDGTEVTVNSVAVPEGGFVVIHDLGVVEGEVIESIVGTSEYLEAGTHENVTIELDESLNESQRLVAVVYRDSNENQEYDFVTSNRTADGPYTGPDSEIAINDFANVTVENGEEE